MEDWSAPAELAIGIVFLAIVVIVIFLFLPR